jgi:tetratricopeptide (TPR) repeat protein
MLSGIYAHPSRLESQNNTDTPRWYPARRYSQEMEDSFKYWSLRAIEELMILDHYAPNQPWIHLQLAYSYSDLQMIDAEIKEYETILALLPNDSQTLFKLGMLYLQQGHNAKALYIYEQLLTIKPDAAEELIWSYGANHPKL